MANLLRDALFAVGLFTSSEALASDAERARQALGAPAEAPCVVLLPDEEPAALHWASGTVSVIPRLPFDGLMPRECITEARKALAAGDASVAVEWVAVGQGQDARMRAWVRTHPDAVVVALRES